jgi:hypothetical protein
MTFNLLSNVEQSPIGLRYSARVSTRSFVRVDKANGVLLYYGSMHYGRSYSRACGQVPGM